MADSRSVLICENDATDLQTALSIVRSFGTATVNAFGSSFKALQFLETCLAGARPIPSLLIVDLDLESESGYEIIRYWRTSPALSKTPLIVWSVLGDDHAQVCEMFKISYFVPNWEGKEALASAIGNVLR